MGTDIDFGSLYFITPDGKEISWECIGELSIEPIPEAQPDREGSVWLDMNKSVSFECSLFLWSNNWLKMHGYAMAKRKPARKRRTRSKKKQKSKFGFGEE